jgi:hypothetical protein
MPTPSGTPFHPAHDDGHWARYNADQAGRDVRATFRRAVDLTGPGAGRTAVELGTHDAWAGTPDMTFLTAAEASSLADGLTVEHWHEQDEVGPAFSGPKHWHVFELIARRPR